MAQELQGIARRQGGDSPSPFHLEQQHDARESKGDADEMYAEIERVLVPFAPATHPLTNEAADAEDDADGQRLGWHFRHEVNLDRSVRAHKRGGPNDDH